MLEEFLAFLGQEPPIPQVGDELPGVMPSPVLLIVVALAVAGIVAWKYRVFLEFVAITCATIGGFIIGLILTPPYANIGLGMMVSLAVLLLSTALVILIRLFRKAKQVTPPL